MTDVPCLPKEKDNSKERIAKYHHFKFANCLGELIIAEISRQKEKLDHIPSANEGTNSFFPN